MAYEERPNACCREEENLGPEIQETKDTTYRRCKVCGCRHFEMTVDPGVIGIKGNSL